MAAALHRPGSNASSQNISGIEWSPEQYQGTPPGSSHGGVDSMYDVWASPSGGGDQPTADPFLSSAAATDAAAAQQMDYLSCSQQRREEERGGGQFTPQMCHREGPLGRLGGVGGDYMSSDSQQFVGGTPTTPRSRAPASLGAPPPPPSDGQHTAQQQQQHKPRNHDNVYNHQQQQQHQVDVLTDLTQKQLNMIVSVET
jgi:hypothetical protein